MQLTIPQAAKLYKKHRTTFHRHIDPGVITSAFLGAVVRVMDLS